jgi:hypothetical protein
LHQRRAQRHACQPDANIDTDQRAALPTCRPHVRCCPAFAATIHRRRASTNLTEPNLVTSLPYEDGRGINSVSLVATTGAIVLILGETGWQNYICEADIAAYRAELRRSHA